jgi:hypothetical protein
MSNIQGKKVNEVFQTKDYDKFKFIKGNRPIIESHVKNLAKNMIENGWLTGSYIVINGKLEIIDGQNRLEAAKIAKIAVHYIIEKSANEDTVHGLNKNRKGWKIINHIQQFVDKNNRHYISLQEFMNTYPHFRPTEAMMFCKNKYVRISAEHFESGQFTVNDMNKASKWAEKIIELKPYFKDYNKALFVRAIIISLSNEDFNLNEFVKKVKLRPLNMVSCGSVEQYIETIEKVYNHYRTDKITLQ